MFIKREYEIWRAVADDETRPALTCIMVGGQDLVDRLNVTVKEPDNGLAVATDGFVLAVVPVELEPDDVPGLVQADLVKAAGKATPRSLGRLWLGLDQQQIRLMDGSTHRRDIWGNYPDVGPVIPDKRPGSEADTMPLHPLAILNAYQLVELCRALGLPWRKSKIGECAIRFSYTGATYGHPVIVEPGGLPVADSWRAPFGLLMPLIEGNEKDAYYKGGRPRTTGMWKQK